MAQQKGRICYGTRINFDLAWSTGRGPGMEGFSGMSEGMMGGRYRAGGPSTARRRLGQTSPAPICAQTGSHRARSASVGHTTTVAARLGPVLVPMHVGGVKEQRRHQPHTDSCIHDVMEKKKETKTKRQLVYELLKKRYDLCPTKVRTLYPTK